MKLDKIYGLCKDRSFHVKKNPEIYFCNKRGIFRFNLRNKATVQMAVLNVTELGMQAIPEPILSVFQVFTSDAETATFLVCSPTSLKLVKCERSKKGRKNIWHKAALPV